ncbi:hypothetical protein A9978_10555 [Pseudomonas sp. UMC65]|nr:hypothetical protein [Pseudomonas sp. UMC65]MBB1623390.1 hypothetical protein [Pseudomonas sp. UME65]
MAYCSISGYTTGRKFIQTSTVKDHPPQVAALLSEQNKHWLTGSRRVLLQVQQQLCDQGVPSTITLAPETAGAIPLDRPLCHADAVLSALRRRLQ